MLFKEKVSPFGIKEQHTYAQITNIGNVSTKRNIPHIIIKLKEDQDLQKLSKSVIKELNKKSNIQINNIRITKHNIAIKYKNANFKEKAKYNIQYNIKMRYIVV